MCLTLKKLTIFPFSNSPSINTMNISQLGRQAGSQSVSQSVSLSANQPASQPASQSASQSVSQSVSQSINHSVSQSLSQWSSHSVSHTIMKQSQPLNNGHCNITTFTVSVIIISYLHKKTYSVSSLQDSEVTNNVLKLQCIT